MTFTGTTVSYIALWTRRLGPYLMVAAVAVGAYNFFQVQGVNDARNADRLADDIALVEQQRESCEFGNESRAQTRVKDVVMQERVQGRVIHDLSINLAVPDTLAALYASVAATSAAEEATEVTNEYTPGDRDCVALFPLPAGASGN